MIKATPLNNQFSSALTAEDHSLFPNMDGNPFPEMQSFTIVKKVLSSILRLISSLTNNMEFGRDDPVRASPSWHSKTLQL